MVGSATVISYARNHADVLLNRAFPEGTPGFYIDIGAADALRDSITKHFYDLGWRGINVEPATDAFASLSAARSRDINLNVAVSDVAGSGTLHEFPDPDAQLSTLVPEQAEWHHQAGLRSRSRSVTTTTLAAVCAEHAAEVIDFLAVDVEGFERRVLAGADWVRHRPRIVVVDASPLPALDPAECAWEDLLLRQGYHLALFDGMNRYFVRGEDRRLLDALRAPVSALDGFSSYEIVMTRRELAASRALGQARQAQIAALPVTLDMERARRERVERGLAAARAEQLRLQDECARLVEINQQSQRDIAALAEDAVAALRQLDSLGPTALGIARRLHLTAARFPRLGRIIARGLRGGRRVERRLLRRSR